jgi:hypothetical protein
MLERGFLAWVCLIAALLFSLVWLLAAVASGWSVPHWVGPAGLFSGVLAVALGWAWPPAPLRR